jgi:hypothetical protein
MYRSSPVQLIRLLVLILTILAGTIPIAFRFTCAASIAGGAEEDLILAASSVGG